MPVCNSTGEKVDPVYCLRSSKPAVLVALEIAVILEVGHLCEHGAVLHVMGVHDIYRIPESSFTAIIKEYRACFQVCSVIRMTKVIVIISALHYGIADDRIRDIQPAECIGVC